MHQKSITHARAMNEVAIEENLVVLTSSDATIKTAVTACAAEENNIACVLTTRAPPGDDGRRRVMWRVVISNTRSKQMIDMCSGTALEGDVNIPLSMDMRDKVLAVAFGHRIKLFKIHQVYSRERSVKISFSKIRTVNLSTKTSSAVKASFVRFVSSPTDTRTLSTIVGMEVDGVSRAVYGFRGLLSEANNQSFVALSKPMDNVVALGASAGAAAYVLASYRVRIIVVDSKMGESGLTQDDPSDYDEEVAQLTKRARQQPYELCEHALVRPSAADFVARVVGVSKTVVAIGYTALRTPNIGFLQIYAHSHTQFVLKTVHDLLAGVPTALGCSVDGVVVATQARDPTGMTHRLFAIEGVSGVEEQEKEPIAYIVDDDGTYSITNERMRIGTHESVYATLVKTSDVWKVCVARMKH